MKEVNWAEVTDLTKSWVRIFHTDFYNQLFLDAREDFRRISKNYEENLLGSSIINMSAQAAEYFGYTWPGFSRQEEKAYDEYIRDIEAAEEDLSEDISNFVSENMPGLTPEIRKKISFINIAQDIFDQIINPKYSSEGKEVA